jgi:hypothetical protein
VSPFNCRRSLHQGLALAGERTRPDDLYSPDSRYAGERRGQHQADRVNLPTLTFGSAHSRSAHESLNSAPSYSA